MKLRSLYILSIVGLLLVIVVQIGGMMLCLRQYQERGRTRTERMFSSGFYRNGGQRD